MTTSIMRFPASDEHASPWPPIGAPCCGRPVTDYEPIPPADMLMGLVVSQRQAMSPALRGLGSCACNGARRTAMSGLGAFGTEVVAEAQRMISDWAREAGLPAPSAPLDAVEAIWRLAQTERELELLRQKLRSMRNAGLPLSTTDKNAYAMAADAWFKAAVSMRNGVVNAVRASGGGLSASLIPAVSRLPSLDAPDGPIPWVPSEADVAAVRRGDLSGVSGRFGEMVAAVRARLTGGMAGLGLFGIDDLTVGVLLLIVVGLIAVAIAVAVPAFALRDVAVAHIAALSAANVAERRRQLYETCLSSGGTSSSCAADAQAVAPTPVYPPPSSFSLDLGGVALVAALAGGAYYFLGTPSGRKAVGLSGLRRRKPARRRR